VKRNRNPIFPISFVYGRNRHSISNFYAACITLSCRTVDAIARRSVGIMKVFFRNSDRRAELSALVTIAIVLAIVAVAKLDATTSLFHLAR
jgi:hypothetical protein